MTTGHVETLHTLHMYIGTMCRQRCGHTYGYQLMLAWIAAAWKSVIPPSPSQNFHILVDLNSLCAQYHTGHGKEAPCCPALNCTSVHLHSIDPWDQYHRSEAPYSYGAVKPGVHTFLWMAKVLPACCHPAQPFCTTVCAETWRLLYLDICLSASHGRVRVPVCVEAIKDRHQGV